MNRLVRLLLLALFLVGIAPIVYYWNEYRKGK
jgi:hypothetical protein